MIARKTFLTAFAVMAAFPFVASIAQAEDLITYETTIKNHRFTPDTIEVPAGKPFYLLVKNADKTVEEFDSYDLHREKVIHGGREAKIKLLALKPGTYTFMGEFHDKTAQGAVVVK